MTVTEYNKLIKSSIEVFFNIAFDIIVYFDLMIIIWVELVIFLWHTEMMMHSRKTDVK